MLSIYRHLFAVPHVAPLLCWSILSRLYLPGIPVSMTFLVTSWERSYAEAGLVVGAFTVGVGLISPLRGRMADRGDTDRLMLVCGIAVAVGFLVVTVLPAHLWWLAIPVTLVSGLFAPPANQVVRGLWPRIVTGRDRQAVYGVEATLQELLYIVGPTLTAGAVAVANPRVALVMVAASALAGSVGLAVTLRRAGLTSAAPEQPTGAAPRTSLVRVTGLLPLFGVMLLVNGGVVAVDMGIVAWANELARPEYVMVLASVLALGSLAGGLIAVAMRGTPRLFRRAFACALGVAVLASLVPPVLQLPSPLLVAPALFLAGMAFAPTLAAAMDRISDVLPVERRAEGFGWLTTAMTTGAALGSPLVGALMDLGGIALGFGGAATMIAVAAVLALRVPASASNHSAARVAP